MATIEKSVESVGMKITVNHGERAHPGEAGESDCRGTHRNRIAVSTGSQSKTARNRGGVVPYSLKVGHDALVVPQTGTKIKKQEEILKCQQPTKI